MARCKSQELTPKRIPLPPRVSSPKTPGRSIAVLVALLHVLKTYNLDTGALCGSYRLRELWGQALLTAAILLGVRGQYGWRLAVGGGANRSSRISFEPIVCSPSVVRTQTSLFMGRKLPFCLGQTLRQGQRLNQRCH